MIKQYLSNKNEITTVKKSEFFSKLNKAVAFSTEKGWWCTGVCCSWSWHGAVPSLMAALGACACARSGATGNGFLVFATSPLPLPLISFLVVDRGSTG
jgi:hypothetical protein